MVFILELEGQTSNVQILVQVGKPGQVAHVNFLRTAHDALDLGHGIANFHREAVDLDAAVGFLSQSPAEIFNRLVLLSADSAIGAGADSVFRLLARAAEPKPDQDCSDGQPDAAFSLKRLLT